MDTDAVTGVRASDVDRERVAGILRAAAGTGLLGLDEVDERLASVYAATYVSDLAPLTADLPHGGRRLAPVDLGARRRALLGARLHLVGYLAVVLLMVGIWVATGANYHFWPIWPALGMLPGVLVHFALIRHAGDPARSPFSRAAASPGLTAVFERAAADRPAGRSPHRPQFGCAASRARHTG